MVTGASVPATSGSVNFVVTTNVAAAAGVTMTGGLVPAIEAVTESFAVIVWFPAGRARRRRRCQPASPVVKV